MDKKKLIAPVIVSVVLILILGLYLTLCIVLPVPFLLKIVAGIIIISFMGVVVYVLQERIKEIRSGEEDDISKY